jgi:ribonuclease P protein component
VGNAVIRNRVKRQLRESIRRHQTEASGCWDVVFIANPRAKTAGQEAITAQVCSVFTQLSERAR